VEHLKAEEISAFFDRELTAEDMQRVRQHLEGCHACSLRVVSAMQLKEATAAAGRRFEAPADVMARLTAQVQAKPAVVARSSTRRLLMLPAVAWTALAASLVLVLGLTVWQGRREAGTLSAELLDQHLATLSSAAAPQVVSTDRHTVKPWFQGKLPFSFNLPEPSALPSDTVLRGADFTYVRGQPAALLLFTIHQHEVSVFLTQRSGGSGWEPGGVRSGFAVRSATTKELRIVGVSDVNPVELEELVKVVAAVQ
jgi:anti-sigma factor RsiW